MFFQDKIRSIRTQDRVLEIGPGSNPHIRSNEFLELKFDIAQDKIAQRGGGLEEGDFSGRRIHYYDGSYFPFKDNQFDYVICSHVLEHVEDPLFFMNEIFRVGGGRGYLEYPLATYEYLYDFDVHLQFLKFDSEQDILRYLPKNETAFSEFKTITFLFNQMLIDGWDDLCTGNKKLFFEGFEFDQPFEISKTREFENLLPPRNYVVKKSTARKVLGRILNSLGL